MTRPPRWALALGVQEAWDTRGLTDALEGPGQLATRFNGAPAHARSLRLSVSDVLRSDYTDEDPLLLDEGTVLRRVSSRTNSAHAGLSYALSARTELSGSVRHDVWRFDSEEFIGRSRLGMLAGIRRQV